MVTIDVGKTRSKQHNNQSTHSKTNQTNLLNLSLLLIGLNGSTMNETKVAPTFTTITITAARKNIASKGKESGFQESHNRNLIMDNGCSGSSTSAVEVELKRAMELDQEWAELVHSYQWVVAVTSGRCGEGVDAVIDMAIKKIIIFGDLHPEYKKHVPNLWPVQDVWIWPECIAM